MDGLSNGCSTIGISTMQPVEILEQRYPVLFKEFALREGSGGSGQHRGGFGVRYAVELCQGWGRASFVMDHGRFGPQGVLGGKDGAVNEVRVERGDAVYIPPHLSKDQGIEVVEGDIIHVSTPGGGGYGEAKLRQLTLIEKDLRRGYYSREQVAELWGEELLPDDAGG